MKRLTSWICTHQVASFFIFTFIITWGLGFSYSAVIKKGNYLFAPLLIIATCGPALAGIIITAICDKQPREGSRKAYWIAFAVAWFISAIVFLANNIFINHAPLSPIMVGFTLVMVIPVALVISAAYSRQPMVKSYLSSLIRFRGVWGWVVLALVLTPVLILISLLIGRVLGGDYKGGYQYPDKIWVLIGLVIVKFLYQFFFFNATGEEAGWRGFALPRLQSRLSPLIAALILALFWPPWHFFLWQAEGQPVMTLKYWVEIYASHIPAALLIAWFYNRSKGSILVAGIVHASANTAFMFVPNLNYQVFIVVSLVFILVIILADRMWKKLPPEHPAVYKKPEFASQTGTEI